MLFHETTDLYRFHRMQSTVAENDNIRNQTKASQELHHLHRLVNQIGQGISSTVKDDCIATFQEQVNYLSSLLACWACEIRSFTTQDGRKVTLEDPLIQLLRLNKEDMEQHDSLGVYKNVCSIFTDTVNPSVRFFLHPELVETLENGNYEVYLCSDCLRQLHSGTVPKLSVANGNDYGFIDRLPELEPLTLVSFILINKILLFYFSFYFLQLGRDVCDRSSAALRHGNKTPGFISFYRGFCWIEMSQRLYHQLSS